MADCDKNALRSKIIEYWQQNKSVEYYIKNILPREMVCAKEDDRLPGKQCDRLVLLVGYSLEPLLQTVWVYRPNRVLLILNNTYGDTSGWDKGDDIEELLNDILVPQINKNLPSEKTMGRITVACEVIKGEKGEASRHVFQKLLNTTNEDVTPTGGEVAYSNLIDITGAKKSMVAGAFSFAAFAGIPVSYVDFEIYDEEKGKPFGYTCQIGEIANPYKDFSLREWERVRTLYARYNFRGARNLLEERVEDSMQVYLAEHLDKVQLLKQIFRSYEQWDNGDFCGAWETTQAIQKDLTTFKPPTTVEVLGKDRYWPHGEKAEDLLKALKKVEFGNQKATDSIYLSPHKLLNYARDEIERISRLMRFNEDYRSTLLRSVSLWEILLRARTVGLWHSDLMEIGLEKQGPFTTKSKLSTDLKAWEGEVYNALIWTSSGDVNIPSLRYTDEGRYKKKVQQISCFKNKNKNNEQEKTFYLRRSLIAPRLNKNVLIGDASQLRNKAIHTYLSVPRGIANNTYQTVRTNLEDYIENWLPAIFPSFTPLPLNTEPMPWSKLCKICQLNTFLPPNLRRNERTKEPLL